MVSDSDPIVVVRDMRYGFGPWKPRCLQGMNTTAGVVTCLCLGSCFQAMITGGITGVVLSTLEKRFSLSSSQSSWIASAYEVGSVPVLLVLSYVGTR